MTEKPNLSVDSLSLALVEEEEVIDVPIITSIIPGRSGTNGSQTLRFEWKQGDKYSCGKRSIFKLIFVLKPYLNLTEMPDVILRRITKFIQLNVSALKCRKDRKTVTSRLV